jgi:hypothetical protein
MSFNHMVGYRVNHPMVEVTLDVESTDDHFQPRHYPSPCDLLPRWNNRDACRPTSLLTKTPSGLLKGDFEVDGEALFKKAETEGVNHLFDTGLHRLGGGGQTGETAIF